MGHHPSRTESTLGSSSPGGIFTLLDMAGETALALSYSSWAIWGTRGFVGGRGRRTWCGGLWPGGGPAWNNLRLLPLPSLVERAVPAPRNLAASLPRGGEERQCTRMVRPPAFPGPTGAEFASWRRRLGMRRLSKVPPGISSERLGRETRWRNGAPRSCHAGGLAAWLEPWSQE